MSFPEHGVTGLGGAGEGVRAVVQGGLVQRGWGEHDGAAVAPEQSLTGAALRGPGSVVPAVLPQAVRQKHPRRAADGGDGAAGAGGERRGIRGLRRREVVVFLHVIQTLDGNS